MFFDLFYASLLQHELTHEHNIRGTSQITPNKAPLVCAMPFEKRWNYAAKSLACSVMNH
jgi:hypothetical protein